jgi:hypothetical protein
MPEHRLTCTLMNHPVPLITTTTDKQGLFVVSRTSTADVSAYRRSIAQNFSSNRTGRTFTSYPPYENDSVRLFQLYAYGGLW